MKIGIFCRENDVNLISFIEKLISQDEKNIIVLVEEKIQKKNSKRKIWQNENFDLNILEKIISIIYSIFKRFNIKKKYNLEDNKNKFNVNSWCSKNNIRYFNSPHNSFETEACIKREKINHIFLLSGGIIKNNILNIENLIVYNAHPGRLPRHRGLSSLEWSIIENYPTSLTLHTLNNKIDEGDIIKIVDFKPKNNESINDFKKRMINFKPTIFSEVIKNIKNNNLVRIKQDYYEGIIHRKLSRRERKSLEKSYSILNNSTRGF